MDLFRLRHIVAVAQTASFSRAAEEVHVTQPALSRSIAAFEARYGVRLFERGRGGAVPTSTGRMVVAHARAILTGVRELEDNLRSHAVGEVGEVAIGLGPLVASLILPPLGRQLLATRPRLRLRTTIKPTASLLGELADDRLELLLGSPTQPDILTDFVVRTIVRLPLTVVVRGDHPLAGHQPVLTSDLARWPVAGQILHSMAIGAEVGVFACENYHVLRDVVLSSDCYWCTFRGFVAEELADGRLAALDVANYPFRDLEIAIMRRRARTPSPAGLAVEEEAARLLEQFGS